MRKLYNINFSPTGSSLKVAEEIAKAFDIEKEIIDLCEKTDKELFMDQDDICIFSAPCYGGRMPETAEKRISHIHGKETSAIVCITFGNRAFEDALLEMADCVEANGFQVVAGCAVATEHNIMHIFGRGRPDASDIDEIRKFSLEAARKVKDGKTYRPLFSGNYPYKERHGAKMPVLVNEKTCISCGSCSQKCPVKAISEDGMQTDSERCINCMRCINVCPKQSRYLPEESVTALIQRLEKACKSKKSNEFYL